MKAIISEITQQYGQMKREWSMTKANEAKLTEKTVDPVINQPKNIHFPRKNEHLN